MKYRLIMTIVMEIKTEKQVDALREAIICLPEYVTEINVQKIIPISEDTETEETEE